MTDYEDRLRDLLKRATAPAAIVVAPGALADPQAFADAQGVEVREWAGCTAGVYYVRSVGEQPMGELVATPTSSFCRNDRSQLEARSACAPTIVTMTTSYTRWAVYIGDKPAPINSTPPVSSYEDADLFARDISTNIKDTNVVSVLGFKTPRSDKETPGDVLVQYRNGQRINP